MAVLSAMCLFLVLINEIKEGEDGNRLALPHGITPSVVAAQYCGELHVKQHEYINLVWICLTIFLPFLKS